MKKRLITLIVAALITTIGLTLAGCRGEQSSTLPYISSKDEIYYATDGMPAQTQPVSSNPKKDDKDSKSNSSENPNAKEIAENTTYPTAVSQSSSSQNNVNPNASSISGNSKNPISLSSSAVDLKIGQSKTISVTINVEQTGNSSYTVEASNNNISVSCSGADITITGAKAGNTALVVKSGDKKASCNVIILGNKTANQSNEMTDDTEVAYKKLCTDYYQTKITSDINIYFYNDGKGAVYTSSLKKDDSEANVIEVKYSSLKDKKTSVNTLVKDLSKQFENEIKKNEESDQFDIKNYRINCYSEKQGNGEYNIYFCYKKL